MKVLKVKSQKFLHHMINIFYYISIIFIESSFNVIRCIRLFYKIIHIEFGLRLVWKAVQLITAIFTWIINNKKIWRTKIACNNVVHDDLFFSCYFELGFNFALPHFFFCIDGNAILSLEYVNEEQIKKKKKWCIFCCHIWLNTTAARDS